MTKGHRVAIEPSPKRVRVMLNGKTVADSLNTLLLFETGQRPIYYFPRRDVRADFLRRTDHRSHCPFKGDASYWTLAVGDRTAENAVWGYEQPIESAAPIKDHLAFYWDRVDHWFEEDEEIFGHARDPHKRVDIIPSTRRVRVTVNGEVVADTRRAVFLFETGMPTRYYVPPADVRAEFLRPSPTTTICPYKGRASYWSIEVGDRRAEDALWFYPEPLPESVRVKAHLCFYPEKVDSLEVEGEPASR
jgi:uncharacterized protein (DUF427 family)